MGGICCHLNRNKEAEIKTGSIEDKNLASDAIPEPELEARFGKLIESFPLSNEKLKKKRSEIGSFQFTQRESLISLTLKEAFSDENSQIYSGFWHTKSNTKDYKGIIQYVDGAIYEGHFDNGVECGKGRKIFNNLVVYEGNFQNGRFHGQGKLAGIKGEYYEGEWRDGKQHGEGTEALDDGQKYIGEFVDGVKHGRGKISWVDGTMYEGEFREGKIEGEGIKTWKSGKKYSGSWLNELEHGKGILQYSNSSLYDGYFAYGMKHGHGRLTTKDGDMIEGEWVRNKQEGVFTHSGPNKKPMQSEWKDGVLVKSL